MGLSCREDWVRVLPIMWELGECWTCVCVFLDFGGVVCGGVSCVGGEWVVSERVGWCYICVCCESRFFV